MDVLISLTTTPFNTLLFQPNCMFSNLSILLLASNSQLKAVSKTQAKAWMLDCIWHFLLRWISVLSLYSLPQSLRTWTKCTQILCHHLKWMASTKISGRVLGPIWSLRSTLATACFLSAFLLASRPHCCSSEAERHGAQGVVQQDAESESKGQGIILQRHTLSDLNPPTKSHLLICPLPPNNAIKSWIASGWIHSLCQSPHDTITSQWLDPPAGTKASTHEFFVGPFHVQTTQ
jgi:hypothetical protein